MHSIIAWQAGTAATLSQIPLAKWVDDDASGENYDRYKIDSGVQFPLGVK